jgi:hypothetical protein
VYVVFELYYFFALTDPSPDMLGVAPIVGAPVPFVASTLTILEKGMGWARLTAMICRASVFIAITSISSRKKRLWIRVA